MKPLTWKLFNSFLIAVAAFSIFIIGAAAGFELAHQNPVSIYTDPDVGCQYLLVGGGITPRLNGDVHMGCKITN